MSDASAAVTVDLRETLRKAIAEKDAKLAIQRRAARAGVRAQQIVHEAEIHLANFSDPEKLIDDYRATRIKAWAAEGGC